MNWYTLLKLAVGKLKAPPARKAPAKKAPAKKPSSTEAFWKRQEELKRQQQQQYQKPAPESSYKDRVSGFKIAPMQWKASGLVPPPNDPNAHPFFWLNREGKRPSIYRWSWNPKTGEVIVSDSQFHANDIGRAEGKFDEFVRGFFFPAKGVVAMRPYFSPDDMYDDFDPSYRALNNHVLNHGAAQINQQLAKKVPNLTIDRGPAPRDMEGLGVTNNYLLNTYHDLAMRW